MAFNEGFAHAYAFIIDSKYSDDDEECTFFDGLGLYNNIFFHGLFVELHPDAHPLVNEMSIATALFDLWDDDVKIDVTKTYLTSRLNTNDHIFDAILPNGPENASLSFMEICRPLFENRASHKELVKNIVEYYNLLLANNCEQATEIANVFNINMFNPNHTDGNPAWNIQNWAIDDIKIFLDFQLNYFPMSSNGNGHSILDKVVIFEPFQNRNSVPSTYNMGSNEVSDLWIRRDISVESGQEFSFLKNSNLNNLMPFPTVNRHNNFYICNSEITIDNNGSTHIGTTGHSSAHVYVQTDSKLTLNGTLFLNDYSRLVIEPGATLVIGENADINIYANSYIEIRGNLEIAENANFTFSGTGKVIFNYTGPQFANGLLVENATMGNGASISFSGSGNSDIIAEIWQPDLFIKGNSTNAIHMETGKVLMKNDSRLSTTAPLTIVDVDFDRYGSTDKPRGIYTFGQDVSVTSCAISNMKYGFHSDTYYGSHATIEFKQNTVSNCDIGLYTWGKAAKV